ncbi:hypothetical protein [Rhodopirellula sallentina]|uniref:hypothetical protein n=1 Tax=Rhodopirellula sallentina TaxID=1263869 RepID=UPI001F478028|nr:hypothetical protein [Rhodopirellula sallentina]
MLVTATVAVGIAAFKPFAPLVSIHSMVTTSVAEPFSHFDGKFRQFKLSVRNDGRLPVWLSPNDIPISDDSWFAPAGGPTYVELDIDNDNCIKLAAGRARTYDVVMHAEYEDFRLFVHARDWRVRDGYTNLGRHDTDIGENGES